MPSPTALVITHHWVPNFGANLQALGTCRALVGRGFDVRFIDYRPRALVEKYQATVSPEQLARHAAFVSEHLPQTGLVSTQADFEALIAGASYDLLVTGSDAVFRLDHRAKRPDLRFPNPFWLQGARGPKIALAPSAMGTAFKDIPEWARDRVKEAVEDFDLVSARDPWTAAQLRRIGYTGRIHAVPDPVFSLVDVVRAARARARRDLRPYIVLSTPERFDDTWRRDFTALAQQAGYDTVALPIPEEVQLAPPRGSVATSIGPLEWLEVLAGSDGYVGQRFHPVVVSLVAGVPIVSTDLYHSDVFTRKRSKTWLLMRTLDAQNNVHGSRLHRFLTPRRALEQIESQRCVLQTRGSQVQELRDRFERFLDQAAALVPRPA